jgi:hypothetical protein
MKRILSVAFILAGFVLGCKKETCSKSVTLSYQQTFCADPWQNGASDTATLNNVSAYMNANKIYFSDINIKKESEAQLCMACTCKTGKTIYITTEDSEPVIDKLKNIGFQ